MSRNIGTNRERSEKLREAIEHVEERELELKRLEFVEWQQSEHFDVDDVDYETVEKFIETCGQTMVPAIVSAAVKAAKRTGCFRSDLAAMRFIATAMEEESQRVESSS